VILGVVSVQGLPTIILPIAGQDWPATIDTGFNGDLELPDALRDTLNAHFVGRATVALAGVKALRKMSIWSIFRLTGG
jgi:predicted aspartyl protease